MLEGERMTHVAPNFASWPVFDSEQIEAATRVLHSGRVNYWTGSEGRLFEQEYSRALSVRHAVALANGTVALELALRVLDIGPGDEVVVPSRTFIATASAVVAVGARPVCADISADTQGLTVETVQAVMRPETKAVIAVHLGGFPCEVALLAAWCRREGISLIEDCAQAHGATVAGEQVGTFGDVAAFSFCQDKILTTAGEGGLLVTDDTALYERAWSYKDHGKSYDAVYRRTHPPGFRWLHESFGTNWRMTEIQAAVGRVALRRLSDYVEVRRKHAAVIDAAVAGAPGLRLPCMPIENQPSYYRWYGFVNHGVLKESWSRDRIVAELAARGVPCFTGSASEVYLERAFPSDWRPEQRHPVARELGDTSIALLVHPSLSDVAVEYAADQLSALMADATA